MLKTLCERICVVTHLCIMSVLRVCVDLHKGPLLSSVGLWEVSGGSSGEPGA